MKIAECYLESVSPYSQSKHYETPKLNKELPQDYETRTWRDRMHVDGEGYVIIPPMQFANAVKAASSYLSLPIPGKNRQTFTKHFESGIMVSDPLRLPVKKEDAPAEWVFVPSDGKRGGTTRVPKCFPIIQKWSGKVDFWILDDIITEDAFLQVLETAGNLIGIGRFRPRNWGYYGRFKVTKHVWHDK